MRIGQERGCPPKPNGNSRPAEDSKARNLSGELCFSHGEITRPIPGKANFPGEQLGFEYEVAKEFAKSLGVRLEIVIPPSREALLEYLATGKGDLIAAGMTRTPEREKSFCFFGALSIRQRASHRARQRHNNSRAERSQRKDGVGAQIFQLLRDAV